MVSAAAPSQDLVLVTKSYAGDIAACRRLCASVDRWIDPAIRHDLLIDACDVALFRPLENARRRIVVTETLLPRLRQTTFRGKRYWLNPATLPIRGWIQQQLAKIAHVAALDATAAVMIDSDAEFVRPIDRDAMIRDGRVRLYRKPLETQPDSHARWHKGAAKLFALDLPPAGHFGADYIAQVVTWSPAVARAMVERLDARSMHAWYLSLGRQVTFSEYVLYGVFAGSDAAAQSKVFIDETDLCLSIWNPDELAASADEAALARALRPHHVAVHVQSNLALDAPRRAHLLSVLTSAAATDAAASPAPAAAG